MAKIMLTKLQKQIMKHAVSGPGRNWFATDLKSRNSQEFLKLVKQGLATKDPASTWVDSAVIYRLTQKGKNLI